MTACNEVPSMEFAFTSCAQSTNNAGGILSHAISSGSRTYTWAEESC